METQNYNDVCFGGGESISVTSTVPIHIFVYYIDMEHDLEPTDD